MTRYLLMAVAAVLVCVASSPAATLVDCNFEGHLTYGGDGTSIHAAIDSYGSWQAASGVIETDNSRSSPKSARINQDGESGMRYYLNTATRTALHDSAVPLVLEYSFYRPDDTDDVRQGGAGGSAITSTEPWQAEAWQMRVKADGDIELQVNGVGGGYSPRTITPSVGNVAGWYDFTMTLDLSPTTAQVTSATVRAPGAAGFEEIMGGTAGEFRSEGGGNWLNMLSFSSQNDSGSLVCHDSIKISEIPEPSTVALFGVAGALGLVVLAFRRRRQRK